MKEFIDSDRVNFLVWRYLLEGNYRETAAKFQKEWHVKEPHRHFDFAPHVQSHALVSVVNRGLLYYSLERDYASAKAQVGALVQSSPSPLILTVEKAAGVAPRPLGVFGPLVTEPPPRHPEVAMEDAPETKPAVASSQQSQQLQLHTQAHTHAHAQAQAQAQASPAAAAPALPAAASVPTATPASAAAAVPLLEDAEATRKRQMDKHQPHITNGSPAKRPRLANGFDTSAGSDPAASTPMDIDSTENQHAYPSPMEREPAPTPQLRTDGPEQGTQIDKVEELAPETIFLHLAPDRATPEDSLAEPLQPGHENPIVLHCEWNPSNPSILAASGTDALARIWTLSRANGSTDAVSGHVNGPSRPYRDLVDEDLPATSSVTTMAWNPDGTAIAIATDAENKARVSVWGTDGTMMTRFNAQEPPVIKLRWNPSGTSLLGIGPDKNGSLISLYSAGNSNSRSYFLPSHDLISDPLDAAWVDDTTFIVSGGDLLLSLQCSESGIVETKKYVTQKDEGFSHVQYDWRSKIVATASDKGSIDLWNEAGERRTISAHIGVITSLMWQPLQSTPPPDERLLASGGEDGAITIWNARIPDGKPKCQMTMDLPVVALAFTPDGAFIAGATAKQILIWKVGEHAIPRASWSRAPHPGWLSPKTSSDSEEEDTHCLCWDTTGQKLAYGVNNRLAVINFR